MSYDIKHRLTGAVLCHSETATTAKECAVEAAKRGAYLRGADLGGADLRGADLRGAYLRDAYLGGAYLRGAYLRGAYLRGADLGDAYLGDADLRGAYLGDADLGDADLGGVKGIDEKTLAARIAEPRPVVPKIAGIHQKLLAALSAEGCRLDMNAWHTCETTHCRAGWITTLAGAEGKDLEKRFGPATAARMIYRESDPDFRTADFFANDADAMADIKACAERERQAAGDGATT